MNDLDFKYMRLITYYLLDAPFVDWYFYQLQPFPVIYFYSSEERRRYNLI